MVIAMTTHEEDGSDQPKSLSGHLLDPEWVWRQLAIGTVLRVEVAVVRPSEVHTQPLFHLVPTSGELLLALCQFLVRATTALSAMAERFLEHNNNNIMD